MFKSKSIQQKAKQGEYLGVGRRRGSIGLNFLPVHQTDQRRLVLILGCQIKTHYITFHFMEQENQPSQSIGMSDGSVNYVQFQARRSKG